MRLKTLEIKGFKSFANETVIHFNENVIGIVGPNGSGKSNVVDAIRWVLGEQKSSELRLDKMNSVIFNGTKKRKAGQLAQVSMTFENTRHLLPTEYATVTITRILYASGESEYRLNGVTCRLKDITTLFMDTGIGSNSYAIIALGMVDDILNDKQNSRRMMFEQAAGVSKYKARKHETLNKLSATEEDLNRVEDLLFEINNNLKTLEKQAKRTQKYFDLKAEYKALAIELAVLKLSAFRQDYQSIEKQIETDGDKLRQVEVDVLRLEAQLEKDKKYNIDNEALLSEKQRELNSTVGRIRGLENDKRMAQQRLQFTEQNNQKLKTLIDGAQEKIEALTEDIDFYRTNVNAEKRLEAKLESQLDDAKTELDAVRQNHSHLKADLDVFLKQQQDIEKALIEFEKQKAIATNQIENGKREAERLDSDTLGRRQEIAVLQEKVAALNQQEQQQVADIARIEAEKEARNVALEQANAALEQATKALSDTARTLDAKKNEYKLTKSMVESLEGFPESIKYLSQNKAWQAPLLSDIIYVEADYRTAIEHYLEPYLNYYVVANRQEAWEAIGLLTQAQKGKANFFLLDAFQQFLPKTAATGAAAVQFVRTDAPYQNLIQYLLDGVFITQNDLKSVDTEGGVLISQSGQFIQRPFSISGGSVGLFEGKKIGRKKNLELLEADIKAAEAELAQGQVQIQDIKQGIQQLKNNDFKAVLNEAYNALNRVRQEKIFTQTRLDNFLVFIAESDAKKQEAQSAIRQAEDLISQLNLDIQNKKIDLEAVKQQMTQADGSYRNIADALTQLSQVYNDKNIAFIQQQNKVNTQQRELSFRERQLQETETALVQNQKLWAQGQEEWRQIDIELKALEFDLQESYKKRKEKEGALNSFEQAYYQNKNAINRMEDELRRGSRLRYELQQALAALKDKFTDIKLQITSVSDRVQVEFGVSADTLLQTPPTEGVDAAELDRKVSQQKKQLDTYGEINPMAVEAYNEMKERHDTIAAQRDDIVAAKVSLLSTIKEIEETATTQFLEAFHTVRLSFIEVFKSLFFEEDTADLILSDPDNPLESGIQIVAKPKGKRPQSISQLSGGEKTLTATALLFALYLYKPAPFCIFDEVDAPLDDANIEKFNKIIKKFSVDSQFIIVTHNKATMAAVDVIYGVHMPEQGVSEVTPVDFRTFGHTAEFAAV